MTGVTSLGRAAIRYFGVEPGDGAAEGLPMTSSALCVVVLRLEPSDFSWRLMRKQSGSYLEECVAASSSRFSDYDEALDASFVALQAFGT